MTTDPGKQTDVVAFVTDMIFATKIRSTADALGVAVEIVGSMEDLRSILARNDYHHPSAVIVDMNATIPSPKEAITEAKAHPAAPRVYAFVSHVQTELADAARSAGADEVWPRSRFVQELPQLLNGSKLAKG